MGAVESRPLLNVNSSRGSFTSPMYKSLFHAAGVAKNPFNGYRPEGQGLDITGRKSRCNKFAHIVAVHAVKVAVFAAYEH